MATRRIGISPELLIHPGETILDLLNERGISQKELANRAGVSEPFLSDVIHGKKDISKGLAKGLEYAFGVSSSFWLNLQANYDSEMMSIREEASVQGEELEVLNEIEEVISYLRKEGSIPSGLSKKQQIICLRKKFQVSNLTRLPQIVPTGAFRMSEKAVVNPYVLGAWLSLCKFQKSETNIDSRFFPECIPELVSKLKKIMFMTDGNLQKDLGTLFAQYGIAFSIVHNFRGAPVQGYISRKEDGVFQMVLTIRGAFADIFWFSLFHELGHIINGDIPKGGSFIDTHNEEDKDRERAADLFAAESLIDSESYMAFVEKKIFSYNAISFFAQTQEVPPYIVIGRLQREKIIPWAWYQKDKLKYKWAE
ncbi:MAG: HigA family addiction module antidote protein [Spirochaetales bacterium]|nr:HigA family addiction module antidote protein [Spirochaetales bacterium]